MSKRKYKMGCFIKTAESLFNSNLVYKLVMTKEKPHWKIIHTAYINNMQFWRIMYALHNCGFRKAIKGE